MQFREFIERYRSISNDNSLSDEQRALSYDALAEELMSEPRDVRRWDLWREATLLASVSWRDAGDRAKANERLDKIIQWDRAQAKRGAEVLASSLARRAMDAFDQGWIEEGTQYMSEATRWDELGGRTSMSMRAAMERARLLLEDEAREKHGQSEIDPDSLPD